MHIYLRLEKFLSPITCVLRFSNMGKSKFVWSQLRIQFSIKRRLEKEANKTTCIIGKLFNRKDDTSVGAAARRRHSDLRSLFSIVKVMSNSTERPRPSAGDNSEAGFCPEERGCLLTPPSS